MFKLGQWMGRKKKEEVLLALKLRLTRWRHLLKAEESCLEGFADIREKLNGEYLFDRQYIISSMGRIFQKAYQVAYDTGVLGRQAEETQMYSWLDGQKEEFTAFLRNWPSIDGGPVVIPISSKDFIRSDQAGEMASHLLEIVRKGSMILPQAFIITIQGFLHLLKANHLDHYLQMDPSLKARDRRERYQSLSKALLEAAFPEDLKTVVEGALRSLSGDREPFPALNLWPSPIRSEDLPSFPGPIWTWSGGNLDTLWELLRSIWSKVYLAFAVERASFPRRYAFLSAVVCQRRISGGKIYRVKTLDPANPDGGKILGYRPIGSPGLNPSSPGDFREFRLFRTWPHEELNPDLAQENQEWNHEKREKLAQLSLRVEGYFKRAQEILWEEDRSGNFNLIQLRLQEIPLGARAASAEKLPSLLKERSRYYDRQGKIVCRGIASGPVVPMEAGQDLSLFPYGGILVAPCWSPEWKSLLPRVSAILVEQSPPSSLAFLARSFRVPTISNLPGIMKKTADPAVITVDAEDNAIYRDRVEPLLFSQLLEGPRLEDEPEYLLLEGLLRGVDHSYSPEGTETPPTGWKKCRTLLQGIERAQRQATAVLFDPNTWQHLVRDRWAMPVKAETDSPIYAVDLGGGVARKKEAGETPPAVDQKEITSTPWPFIWQESIPSPGVPLADRGERPPLFLILGENSLFCTRSSGKDKVILDTALSRVTELNHFFLYWEKGEEGGQNSLSCGDKGGTHEIRFFRKSALEVEEQLKQVGQRLHLYNHPTCR